MPISNNQPYAVNKTLNKIMLHFFSNVHYTTPITHLRGTLRKFNLAAAAAAARNFF